MGTKDVYNHAKKRVIDIKNIHGYILSTEAKKSIFFYENVLHLTSILQDLGLYFLGFFLSSHIFSSGLFFL